MVESGGESLLVDAGFSCRDLTRRLTSVGHSPERLGALLLTHEHGDHARGVDVLARRHRLPLFATEGTLREVSLRPDSRELAHEIASGRPFEVAGFRVEAFRLPHDAREPVGFVVEDQAGRRIGLAADLGARTQLAWARLRDLDILILETNHDLQMLRSGPYPWSLKQRIAGRHGHLSNREASEGLPDLLSDRLEAVVLYHLSRTNNLPALAAESIGERLDRERSRAEVLVTDQDTPSPWIEISPPAREQTSMEKMPMDGGTK